MRNHMPVAKRGQNPQGIELVFVYALVNPGKSLLEKWHVKGLYTKRRAGKLIKGFIFLHPFNFSDKFRTGF